MKIVIADDSVLLRDRIKSLLKSFKNNLQVYEAENGIEALHLVDEVKPDLVILDIRMPVLNGIDVLKKIREKKLQVKICILTNYTYPQYKLKCYEAGVDYFLNKSEEFDDIKSIIGDLLHETYFSD